ncbi:hypothetical protein [Acinetobacter guillouiae]|uniref:hypothetical protein n=1 Tax=Acinetobacter guillouiae TaxID=106649 RepID=UPI003341534E
MIKNYFYAFILCGQASTMQAFANSKEKSLMFNSEQNEIKMESISKVDFFEFKKEQEEATKKQRYENALRVHEDSLNTSSMNDYEKTQYYLKKNDMNAVKSIENQKQMQYLNKAKDRGIISNEEYSKKFSKLTPHFSNQSNKNQ